MEDSIWGLFKSFTSVAGLAASIIFAGLTAAAADQVKTTNGYGAQNILTSNTLVYTEKDGQIHSIYFGRFDNFDLYFPCQFESGTWNLGADQSLRLTYDGARIKPKRFKLLTKDGRISFMQSMEGTVTEAKLLDGNRLPVG